MKCFLQPKQYGLKVEVKNKDFGPSRSSFQTTSGSENMLRSSMKRVHVPTIIMLATLSIVLTVSIRTSANTRTLETPFALSSDARSEFSTRFQLPSAGSVVVEAEWRQAAVAVTGTPVSLTLVLTRPDGLVAASSRGTSILRLEHSTNGQEFVGFTTGSDKKWTIKILNDADANRFDLSGTVRITVPTASRVLEDTQFTLLGSGNAQEIPFNIPGPGRIDVEAIWQTEVASAPSPAQTPLIVSFIHPGEARTYARRQGPSPIRFDHQVTDIALDRGARWIVRVQNDTQTKVKGRIKVTYTPSL